MSNETYNSYLDAEGLALVLSGIRDKINAAAEGITNTKGKANGIASLDAGGNVPLSQLGNLDTTFFEVVTELPTDIRNIKKHIYILKGNKDGDNNKYAEYIYTGDLTDAGDLAGDVDATKWEKLGDFVPTFDLQEYVKKAGAVAKLEFYDPVWDNAWNGDNDQPSETAIRIEFADGSHKYLVVPEATAPTNTSRSNSELSDSEKSKPFISPGSAGFMSPSDKGKLDKIDLNALTASINAANTAADNTNKAIKAAEAATTGAEKVDATLTEGNVFEVTGRTGVKKTLDMSGLVSAQSDVARIQESMGAYSDRPDITLVAKETNKAISADGVKVAKTGWAIAEFTAEKGNIYLFKPNDVDGDVCIFAEEITNIETRGIDYTYTYNADGTIKTAKATYLGATHIYTFSYADDKSYTITDEAGETVEALPMTYETKVGSYSPLVRLNADAELPIDGYCRYMSHFKGNSSIKIVVSYKIDAADLVMKVVRDGVFASISTQLGNLSQKEDETRKKIEEYHGSYIELLCKTDTIVIVDGKEVTIPAMKRTKVYPKVSYKPKIQVLGAGKETMPTILVADVSHLDTSNFTSMDSMFRNCYLLTELDVSHFDTSKVTNMSNMFQGCSSLTSLNVSGFDTSKVTNMSNVFSASGVQKLDLRGWNVENVLTMQQMFLNCYSLATINLTEWNAIKCTNMGNMFNGCIAIQNIYGLSTLVKAACQEMPSFHMLPDIDLDLSGWDTSGVKRLNLVFYRSSLKTIDCSGDGWNNVNVSNVYRFLEGVNKFKLGKNFFNMPLIDTFHIDSYVPKEYLVEGIFDRKAAGQSDMTLHLIKSIKDTLTESDIATMTTKGYIIAS